ncbi:MAG: hypothetical protein AB7E85_02435 [Pseudobdellovibrionaceae bacterium]
MTNVAPMTKSTGNDAATQEKIRRLILSSLSYLASKGNEDALKAMDEVQEIASKKMEELDPKLRAHIEKALASVRK